MPESLGPRGCPATFPLIRIKSAQGMLERQNMPRETGGKDPRQTMTAAGWQGFLYHSLMGKWNMSSHILGMIMHQILVSIIILVLVLG